MRTRETSKLIAAQSMSRMSHFLLQAGMCVLVAAISPQAAGWVPGSQGAIVYQLYVPDTSIPGKKLPFVVWEAGNTTQGNSNNLNQQMFMKLLSSSKIQSANPCFILAPQCPTTGAGCWIDLCWSQTTYSIASHPNTVSPEQDIIDAANAIVKKYGAIDTNRIHMTGGSMGGYGAWFAACKYPKMFASLTAISGGGDTSCAKFLTSLPIRCYAQADDGTVPVAGSRLMINAIKKAGGDPKYTEFNGIPTSYGFHMWDQVWDSTQTQLYQPDLLPWMFSQAKGSNGPGSTFASPRHGSSLLSRPSIVVRGNMLAVSGERHLRITVLDARGRVIVAATVTGQSESLIPLARHCSGVLHVLIHDGARESVESVSVGTR
jgi:pimeloyl-ACP methyl ester carboxylesterase